MAKKPAERTADTAPPAPPTPRVQIIDWREVPQELAECFGVGVCIDHVLGQTAYAKARIGDMDFILRVDVDSVFTAESTNKRRRVCVTVSRVNPA